MIVDRIQEVFEVRKKKNPAYSLRSFARSLDLDPSCVSAILRKKRSLTFKMARKILESLPEVDSEKRMELLEMANLNLVRKVDPEKIVLKNDQFSLIADWWNFAILASLELHKEGASPSQISKRLGIDSTLTNISLQRLENLGLVVKSGGAWKVDKMKVSTTDGFPSKALKECHRQTIELAKNSLEGQEIGERDISGVTFSCSSKNLDRARDLIRKFRKDLCELMEGERSERDRVYRLNIQLFALDKIK